jgi:hypothetical protein
MQDLCWLLGTSVHKIGDVRRDNLSRLSSCLHEEMHGARKSGAGKSLFLNTDAPLPATRQREDAFSSSVERKQGREDLNT